MFHDMYQFECIDGTEQEKLGIIVNLYVHNDSDINFQVEVIKENEVKLVSCQEEYTTFRSDLVVASNNDSLDTIHNSMFNLDRYKRFTKFCLKRCIYTLQRITKVIKYHCVRCKNTSSILLYLQQRGKKMDKIPHDKTRCSITCFDEIIFKSARRENC